jgi:hypothetical protein
MSVDREGMPRGIRVQSACSSPVCSRYTGLQQVWLTFSLTQQPKSTQFASTGNLGSSMSSSDAIGPAGPPVHEPVDTSREISSGAPPAVDVRRCLSIPSHNTL